METTGFSIAVALQAARVSLLLSALPPWVDKATCVLSEPRSDLKLTFHCCCAVKKQQVGIRKGGGGDKDHAFKLGAAVDKKHAGCWDAGEKNPAEATSREQLHGEVKTLKRKLLKADSQAALLFAKVTKIGGAEKAQSEVKRQQGLQDQRTLDIDPLLRDKLDGQAKKYALTAPNNGLIPTMKYWARGSLPSVLQLIMGLIAHFELKEQVAAELEVGLQNETHNCIVERLGDALQVLKQCRSEEQRQHFRVVLTALAPAKVDPRFSKGMSRRVAKALRISRQSKPFMESVDLRAHIDTAALTMNDPLLIGDSVVTRHGVGTLLERGDELSDPCAVQIVIGDVVHVSKFPRMDAGEGGGRVRRLPISFASASRAARKDKTQDDVKGKVRVCLPACLPVCLPAILPADPACRSCLRSCLRCCLRSCPRSCLRSCLPDCLTD